MMLVTAMLETAGFASVTPFVSLVMNPDAVESNRRLKPIYDWFGFANSRSFLFTAGIVVLVLFLGTIVVRAATSYAIVRFATMQLHAMACGLFAVYLRQPYEFFLQRNTAALSKTLLSEISDVVHGVLLPGMRFVAGAFIVLGIFVLLIAVEPVLSLVVAVGLGGTYALAYASTRGVVKRLGAGKTRANRERYVLTNEVLVGVKELRVLGREEGYLDRFRRPSLRHARYEARGTAIRELPRYAIEAVAIGGMIALLLFLISRRGTDEVVPLVALYGLAVYRLLPTLQQMYANLSRLRFNWRSVNEVYEDMAGAGTEHVSGPASAPLQSLPLKRELHLSKVGYRYPGATRWALKEIDLRIPAGASVAFVGPTGAGKTTVIDVILGLLVPTEGELFVDGRSLGPGTTRAWQRAVGYVPQSVFLADDTITANITLGLPVEQVDQARVERAARAAHIHDFIVNELPRGYETIAGDRGIRLSGGERQRLAIARALYHDPSVVVFDEATSALDAGTEASVMEAVNKMHGDKTVIMVAHRLSTLRACDRVYVIDQGRLVDEGTLESLRASSSAFMHLDRTVAMRRGTAS
jgi:ABC-type multidrug transport system fused ATPase/permease subunit